jgi:uncharacterized protein YegL
MEQNAYYCPISHELMTDPVNAPDGRTYDRKNIVAWLEKKPESPFTRQPMRVDELVTNYALRSDVEVAAKPKPETKDVVMSDNETIIVSTMTNGGVTLVSVKPPDHGPRPPLRVCCVIDVSGSMDQQVEKIHLDGSRETDNFTRSDLVLHSVKTIAGILSNDDEFALVAFDTNAKVIVPLDQIHGELKIPDTPNIGGGTNLWEGIATGCRELSRGKDSRKANVLIVLTDGEPNNRPPTGEVDCFQKLLDVNKIPHLTTCTAGYGYSSLVDSDLLRSIARVGGGWFSYVPDAQMVGTIFVNMMANVCCQFTETLLTGDGNKHIPIYPLRYGQITTFAIHGPLDKLRFVAYDGEILPVKQCTFNDANAFKYHAFRIAVADLLTDIPAVLDLSLLAKLEVVEKEFKETEAAKLPFAIALLKDIDSQVKLALTNAHYSRWGAHYLRMWASAHRRQRSTSFKDVGA